MTREPQPLFSDAAPGRAWKYIKPDSLSWWASIAPLIAGLVLASEPLHNLSEVAQTLRNMTGDTPPALLINAGLAGIGIRGALA